MPGGRKQQTAIPEFSAIQFPSDRITIAQIRKEQPYMFTRDAGRGTCGELRCDQYDPLRTDSGRKGLGDSRGTT